MDKLPRVLFAKPVINKRLEDLKNETSKLSKVPQLKIILVGNNQASERYTQNKKIFCENSGAQCEIIRLEVDVTLNYFCELLTNLNNNPQVNGILVQLPLPNHLKDISLDSYISPLKDVDGFHSENLFSLLKARPMETYLAPCTPKGIMSLLDFYKIKVCSKNVVVIGRSLIVGKPMFHMLINEGATVTLCHSKSQEITTFTKNADIIILAVGKANFFNATYLNKDKVQVVIDVGINLDHNNKLCGDLDVSSLISNNHSYTPVPGGVGPLTILSLGENLLQALKFQLKK